MAIEADASMNDRTLLAAGLGQGDRIADDLSQEDGSRSNFAAFLLGGVVIAGGLMAFLYYDNGSNLRRGDDLTTGSIIQAPSLTVPNVDLPAKAQEPTGAPARP